MAISNHDLPWFAMVSHGGLFGAVIADGFWPKISDFSKRYFDLIGFDTAGNWISRKREKGVNEALIGRGVDVVWHAFLLSPDHPGDSDSHDHATVCKRKMR